MIAMVIAKNKRGSMLVLFLFLLRVPVLLRVVRETKAIRGVPEEQTRTLLSAIVFIEFPFKWSRLQHTENPVYQKEDEVKVL